MKPKAAFSTQARAALKHLRTQDLRLAELMAKVGPYGLVPPARVDPFSALFRAICHQQLTGKAATTIMNRVKDRVGEGGWPTPLQVKRARLATLRKAGLSRAKALALKDLAEKSLDGTVPTARALRKLSDDEVVERLTQVRGIGRWTVEMLLMFQLGRYDVLPVDDYGVRKGFSRWYGHADLVHKSVLTQWGEKWRPYRSVASWYMWRVLELDASER
ncbi:MAG: DNA-3-methyladenine glycosylase [Myxococcaceae bacterium]|nr:DNA-3-methyladenine glycosylase [Myxococcaceae bacterium]